MILSTTGTMDYRKLALVIGMPYDLSGMWGTNTIPTLTREGICALASASIKATPCHDTQPSSYQRQIAMSQERPGISPGVPIVRPQRFTSPLREGSFFGSV